MLKKVSVSDIFRIEITVYIQRFTSVNIWDIFPIKKFKLKQAHDKISVKFLGKRKRNFFKFSTFLNYAIILENLMQDLLLCDLSPVLVRFQKYWLSL